MVNNIIIIKINNILIKRRRNKSHNNHAVSTFQILLSTIKVSIGSYIYNTSIGIY